MCLHQLDDQLAVCCSFAATERFSILIFSSYMLCLHQLDDQAFPVAAVLRPQSITYLNLQLLHAVPAPA